MPKLIKGDNLTTEQRKQVLNAYIYRGLKTTHKRDHVYRNIEKPRIPLCTDQEWLHSHAFWFLTDGSRLSAKHHHAEPAFMADEDKHAPFMQ